MTLAEALTELRVEPGAAPETIRRAYLQLIKTRKPKVGAAGAQAVEVRFSYDLNGLLEVEMTIVSNQRKATLVVEQTPGRLTAAQIASARQELERLKFHPREALPNTTALARADALYVELTGPARAGLGEAIALFRGALDEQEPRAIDAARAQLLDLVDRLGGRA